MTTLIISFAISIIAVYIFGYVIGCKVGEASAKERIYRNVEEYLNRYVKGGAK